MSYDTQKAHFDQAYKTGSDMWTHHNFSLHEKEFIATLPENGMVLDLGAGRGRFTFRLGEAGMRVIGLEYVASIVEKNNDEVKLRGMDKSVRFFEGDVLDIPFTDGGFDGVADVGLLHHLLPSDYAQYVKEVSRVMKNGGSYMLVALSKSSTQYLGFTPQSSTLSDFEYEGAHYHFFTEDELVKLFSADFTIVSHKKEFASEDHRVAYEVVHMKKK